MTAVADFADDFDEVPDEEPLGPMLPRDDRLWRHPSEMVGEDPTSLDPIAVRRRWLQTQPTRASAWTAGLVGALLATGLVILGTHLASALTGDAGPSSPALSSASVTTIPSYESVVPTNSGFGITIAAAVTRVTKSMARVSISTDGGRTDELGLIVNSSGFLMIPSTGAADAASILVTLDNGVQYVGEVVGTDARLGVCLIHINGAIDLPVSVFAKGSQVQPGSLSVAVTSTEGAMAIGSLRRFSATPTVASSPITNAMSFDLSPTTTPLGSVLLNGDGRVSGFVIGESGGRLVAVQGPELETAISGILADQVLSPHVVGLTCETAAATATSPAGARVVAVTPNSASEAVGIGVNEIIVGVNGVTVTSLSSFDSAIRLASPTVPLVLTVFSGSSNETVIIPASIAATH